MAHSAVLLKAEVTALQEANQAKNDGKGSRRNILRIAVVIP